MILEVKLIPSAGRVGIALDTAGRFKIYVKSPPEKGKANIELIKLLAKIFGCPQSYIVILTGATTRIKKVKINLPLTYEEVLRKIALYAKL